MKLDASIDPQRKRADALDYLKHYTKDLKPENDPHDAEGRERRKENYDNLANEYVLGHTKGL